ncbi:MAG: DUF2849 domain-containing protein [Rhizobiaceae bacterium]|nr:DUF2849 domain-containing protein [Rhizobiaceae bacterium]
MTTLKTPIAFTANNLLDGEAVWLGRNGAWVKSVASANVFSTEDERKIAFEAAARADQENLVVEPYEIEVAFESGQVTPLKFRERIRATGPTMRLDLGKQAEQSAAVEIAAAAA